VSVWRLDGERKRDEDGGRASRVEVARIGIVDLGLRTEFASERVPLERNIAKGERRGQLEGRQVFSEAVR